MTQPAGTDGCSPDSPRIRSAGMSDACTQTVRGPGGLAGYRPRIGVHDELSLADGGLRPAWGTLAPRLASLDAPELARRRELGLRLLREHGVTYNVYGSEDEKEVDRYS